MTFAPVLIFSWGVGWCSVLLEGKRLFFKVFINLFKCWNQNIINVKICVDINPCSTKTKGDFQNFETAAAHHKGKRLLSAINCSHVVINVCWKFWVLSDCYHSLQLWNVFHQKKTISRSVVSVFNSQRRIFSLLNIALSSKCEVQSLSHLVGKQLEIVFKDGFYCGHQWCHNFLGVFCPYVY